MATVINAYRNAIDDYFNSPSRYDYTKYLKELEKTKTRGLTTFYFNDRNNKDFQDYTGNQYNSDYEYGGKVIKTEEDLKTVIEIKNKLQKNDLMEIIIPGQINPCEFKIEGLWDYETDEEIGYINPGRANQKVKLRLPIEVKEGYIIRRKKN